MDALVIEIEAAPLKNEWIIRVRGVAVSVAKTSIVRDAHLKVIAATLDALKIIYRLERK